MMSGVDVVIRFEAPGTGAEVGRVVVPIVSIALALVVAGVVLAATGHNPFDHVPSRSDREHHQTRRPSPRRW